MIILGPSHHTSLGYCALTTCEKYQTPTGDLKIDETINDKLLRIGNLKLMTLETDEGEHSIEL